MAEVPSTQERELDRLGRPVPRTLNLGTRLTASEAKAIEETATRGGKRSSEWARDILLRNVTSASQTEMEMHIFTELVGIEMLLMKTLEPLLCGDKLSQDQLAILFRQVQTTKAAMAQELLVKRSQRQEK
jgi:hypothetical protein